MSSEKSVFALYNCHVVCGVSRKSGKSYVTLVHDLGYRQVYIAFGYRDVSELLGVSPLALQDSVKVGLRGLSAGDFVDITSDVLRQPADK